MSALRPLARGSAFGLATLIVEKASALVLVVVLARTLSPDDYGRYSFVIAYLTLFQVLADIGLEPTLLRRLSQTSHDRARWLANALGIRVALALSSGFLAIVLTPVAAPGQPDIRLPVAIGAAGLLFVGQPGFRAWLRSELRLDLVLRVAVVTNVLLFVAVGLVVWSGAGLVGLFAGVSAAHLLGWVAAGWIVRSRCRVRLGFDRDVWRPLLVEAWPIGANIFVIMLGLRIAPVLLLSYGGPIDVGYYASSMRLVEALNLVGDGLMLAVLPVFSQFATTNPDGLHALSRVCSKILAVVLLMVSLALTQLSADVLVILFGDDFRAAGSTLAVLSWSALLAGVGTVYTNLLIALGRQRVMFGVNAVSAVIQVGLQVFLVSNYGLLGAATGIVVASAANHMALYLLPATAPWIRPCANAALPLVGLALAVLGAGSLVPGEGLLKATVLVVGFVALALLLGLFGRADLERLREAMSRD